MSNEKKKTPTAHRPGSYTFTLSRLAVGDAAVFEAPAGRLQEFMQQMQTYIARVEGKFTQSLVLGVEVSTREVYEIVRVKRVS